MRRRVPLNAVRAFEAAARHTHLVRAADELCVTPTAISHQIRILEDFLQTKLFVRKGGRLELTPASRLCLDKLGEALDGIDEALATVVNSEAVPERLVIGASASVAALFLMPRLQRFTDSEPEIEVAVQTFVERSAIEQDRTDVWISTWPTDVDRRIEPLMAEDIVPMCAPDLLARTGMSGRQALRDLPLIHDDKKVFRNGESFPTWPSYLAEYGIERADGHKGLRCNQSSVAIEAAIAGAGILLGRGILAAESVRTGRLVPIAEPYPVRHQYYLVSSWHASSRRSGAAFRDWLLREAGELERQAAAGPARAASEPGRHPDSPVPDMPGGDKIGLGDLSPPPIRPGRSVRAARLGGPRSARSRTRHLSGAS